MCDTRWSGKQLFLFEKEPGFSATFSFEVKNSLVKAAAGRTRRHLTKPILCARLCKQHLHYHNKHLFSSLTQRHSSDPFSARKWSSQRPKISAWRSDLNPDEAIEVLGQALLVRWLSWICSFAQPPMYFRGSNKNIQGFLKKKKYFRVK